MFNHLSCELCAVQEILQVHLVYKHQLARKLNTAFSVDYLTSKYNARNFEFLTQVTTM